jgi:outer membrane cobalamin receptor
MRYAAAVCLCITLAFAGDGGRAGIPMYKTEEIVVIARVPKSAEEIPLDVLRIDRNELLARDPLFTGEALRGEASVDVRTYGAPGTAASVALRGATTSQTLVLLDGRPINSLTLGLADLSWVPFEALDRVELVKSPTSSVWGANALGGTINLVTRDAPDRSGVSGQFSFGSDELSTSVLRAGFRSGPLRGWVSGNYKNSKGDRSNGHNFGYGLLGKIEMDAPGHPTLVAGYSAKRQGVPGSQPGEVVPTYGDSTASSVFDKQADTTAFLDLSVEEDLNEHLNVRARGYWDQRVMRFFTVYDLLDELWQPYRADERDRYRTRTLGGTVMLGYNLSEMLDGALGVDVRSNDLSSSAEVTDTRNGGVTADTWSPKSTETGVFGCATVRVSSYLNLFLSARYDADDVYGGFFSPGGGIVVEPASTYRIKLYAGRAFRAPTFNDLYWPLYGNEDLVPEEGTAFEAVLEFEPSDRVGVKLSGFHRNTKNLIAWMPDTLGLWRPTNVNEAKVTGGEVSVDLIACQGLEFELRGGYNTGQQRRNEIVYSDWLSGETRFEEIERDLAFLPGYTASAGMDWIAPFGLRFNARAISVGERVNYYADYSTSPDVGSLEKKLGSYVLLNAYVGYEVVRGIEAFLWAENLLDEAYADQFGTSVDDRDYPRLGRTVGAGIRFDLNGSEVR